ncbi:MAG: hypothetical protein AB8B63_20830 [Granulosicoccus sp.]
MHSVITNRIVDIVDNDGRFLAKVVTGSGGMLNCIGNDAHGGYDAYEHSFGSEAIRF